MTPREFDRLSDEARLLEHNLARALERSQIELGAPRDEGAEPIPLWAVEKKQHRLGQINDCLHRAEVRKPEGGAIIGALMTFRDTDGEPTVYRIVAPGEGDPTLNAVPFDTPFGQLLAKARVGSWISIKIPSGSRHLELVEIWYPHSDEPGDGETPVEEELLAANRAG